MDFLGLRNLTVIRKTLELVEKRHGQKIDFSKMTYDDAKVYDCLLYTSRKLTTKEVEYLRGV